MPRDRTLLHFNLTSRRSLGVVLEDLKHLTHPTHIQVLGKVPPSAAPRLTNEPTVLSRHSETLDMSKMLLQERLVTPGDDVHDILRILGETSERLERRLRGNRHARHLDDRRKCTVVVEQEQPLLRREVMFLELALGDERGLARQVDLAELLKEELREVRRPRV